MNESLNPQLNTLNNPWQQLYWFSRMLINSDQYGGLGKNNQQLLDIISAIHVTNPHLDKENRLSILKQIIKKRIISQGRSGTKRYKQLERLAEDIDARIHSIADVEVFKFTCEHILIPTNDAINNIPSDDKEFAIDIAKALLDKEEEQGLRTIIKIWDSLGIEGSLNAERVEIIRIFGELREKIEKFAFSIQEENSILTAFVQEFERRAGQKRKSRGGRSLEDVTSFILTYFNIPTTDAPDHFQADIEVDKWIKTADNWLIGISCKRTLRERWKQVSSANREVMGRYKIKELWHLVTYSSDLSDDKLAQLGGQRHIFYLPDDNDVYLKAQKHTVLKDHVRPLTQFVSDLKNQNPK